ncbi:hypothetical protein HHI36_021127 [Cryptolaemus montrouzieri]|uniref:Uncharacterized protein n=1 Tax=Cryptolaemus montrouzieri TaxID=559131 RepID=A0ABD2MWN8_9CUCU
MNVGEYQENQLQMVLIQTLLTYAAQKILQDLPGTTSMLEEYLQLKNPPSSCFSFREVTLVEVRNAIDALKPRTSSHRLITLVPVISKVSSIFLKIRLYT